MSKKLPQFLEEDEPQAAPAAVEVPAQNVKDDGDLKNKSGTPLMCELTLGKKEGAPDPHVMTVNEHRIVVKRGAKVVVPWYFIAMLKSNNDRRYYQTKDKDGTV